MSDLRPHGMDLSEAREFPAVVEVVLGNGYRYKTGATDDEARRVILQLSEATLRDEQARHEREHS